MIPDTPQTLLKKIAEYANGDDTAEWAKFVELYEPVIRLYIMQSGNISAADADDIVQDIFVKLVDVLRNDGYKHEKGRFRNYLASMVRRLLIDRHRRETVRQFDMPNTMVGSRVPRDRLGRPGAPHTPSPENIPSNLPDPALIVDMNLVLARHHAAVEHVLSRTMLEERTVAAYREYALEEQPADEVAARHGMTVNNLRQLKYRIDRMIAAIEKQYLF
jgi:RNA polymerase sigma factor (sigma-70 family)